LLEEALRLSGERTYSSAVALALRDFVRRVNRLTRHMDPAEACRSMLATLVGVLARSGIRFHLTGGIAAGAYGEPRMTQGPGLGDRP